MAVLLQLAQIWEACWGAEGWLHFPLAPAWLSQLFHGSDTWGTALRKSFSLLLTALSLAWGQIRNELKACGLELRYRLIRVTLRWVCTTGHLTRKRRLMRPSTGSCKQPHSHRPWFSWGTSTTLTSAGTTIELGRCNPGGSCRELMITF